MARFFGSHREYEELLNEHLDGRLDAAREAKLRGHLESCRECQAELAELEALQGVLHAEAMVEPPRSFTLPLTVGHPARVYGPQVRTGADEKGFFRRAGGGSVAVLRGLQMATAAAALVLVALVGLDVSGVVPGPSETVDRDMMITLSAVEPGSEAEPVPSPAPEPAPPGIAADVPAAPGSPPEAQESDQDVIAEAEPAPRSAPDSARPTRGTAVDLDRNLFEWVKLGLSALTAALALGVAGLSWRIYRNPG